MQTPPGVPRKYRIYASLLPVLLLFAAASTFMLFKWRSQYARLAREKKGRTLSLPFLEQARELADRAEKYVRLPQPDESRFQDIEEMADEAVNQATEAVARGGDVEEVYRVRGRALELLHNFDEAREDYEKAISLHKVSPARMHLGVMITRQLARARLTGMKTALGTPQALKVKAAGELNHAVNPPAEFKIEVNARDRFVARTCVGYLREDWEDVIAQANVACVADETDWFPRYLRGLAAVELKKYPEAARDLELAARIAPAVPDPRAWLGVVYQALGRPADAIDALSAALQASAQFLEAYWVRGDLLLASGRFKDAQADFGACAKLRPSLAEVHLKHGTAAFETWNRTGRRDAAELDQAEESLTRFLGAAPQDGAALLLRARIRLGRKDFTAAEADLGQALTGAREPAEALRLRGEVHEAQKRWDQAEADYTAILDKAADPDAQRRRARARARAGKIEGALADYGALLAGDPRDAGLHHEKGALELDSGKAEEARATVEKGLALGKNARLLVLRGEILLRKGDPAGAARDATEAFGQDPQLAEALVLRGKASLAQGKRLEALDDWKKATDLRPDLAAELAPLIQKAHQP